MLLWIIFIIFFSIFIVALFFYEQKLDENIKKRKQDEEDPEPSVKVEPVLSYKWDMDFNLAGVTFKDGQCKRQTAIKMLKFKDPPMDGQILFEFEQYDYEGKDACRVIANDRILGNVPADCVNEFIEGMTSHNDYDMEYQVVGGGPDMSYGLNMKFRWL